MPVFLMSHIHYHWLNSWPFRVYCFVQWSVFNFIKTGLWEQGGAKCQNQWDPKRWFNLKFVWSLLMIIRFFMITFIMFQTGMMFGCSRPLVPAFPQVSTLSTASSFTSSALWSLGLPTSFWHHCQPHHHHQCQCHHQSQCHHPCSKEYDPPHQQKNTQIEKLIQQGAACHIHYFVSMDTDHLRGYLKTPKSRIIVNTEKKKMSQWTYSNVTLPRLRLQDIPFSDMRKAVLFHLKTYFLHLLSPCLPLLTWPPWIGFQKKECGREDERFCLCYNLVIIRWGREGGGVVWGCIFFYCHVSASAT